MDFKILDDNNFEVRILQKARFVDLNVCTGCGDCEEACPVIVTDHGYDEGLGPIKAVGVPFTTALPQKAVLNVDNCIFCGKCARACPTEAINFDDRDQEFTFTVGSLVIATGYKEQRAIKEKYGSGNITNLVSGLQMERFLSPTGPYGGVFRPSDGKNPWSIAYVLCAGSRDKSIGVPYCSSICCIYSIKQAILLSAAAPLADITIYYMDIRTFGKGHEEFYQEAKAMGINFVKGKVAEINELETGDLKFKVEVFDEVGNTSVQEFEHDLGVLALGLVPGWNPQTTVPVALNPDGFVKKIRPKSEPTLSSIPGVFVVGTASEPKDIMESIMSGSATASKIAQWLNGQLRSSFYVKPLFVTNFIGETVK